MTSVICISKCNRNEDEKNLHEAVWVVLKAMHSGEGQPEW